MGSLADIKNLRKILRMKIKITILFALALAMLPFHAFGEAVEADVTLSPAGSFVGKTNDVKGHAILKGDTVLAQNIVVNLKGLKTGVSLRDTHTLKHLEVDKYPTAVLVKGIGKGGHGKMRLKFRGKEKDISGTYKVSPDKKSVLANFMIVLSEFDITGIKYMGIGVKDSVNVRVTIPIR